MALYQALQGLTWQYNNSTGQLSIITTIHMELGSNEKITTSVGSIYNGTCMIILFIGSSGEDPPITVPVYYTNIGSNLQNASLVRDRLRFIDMVTVRTRVYKNNVNVGEIISTTSQDSEIIII